MIILIRNFACDRCEKVFNGWPDENLSKEKNRARGVGWYIDAARCFCPSHYGIGVAQEGKRPRS